MKTTNDVTTRARSDSRVPPAVHPPAPDERVLSVWVVDDNAPLREVFTQLLDRQRGIRCTRSFASGAGILATLDEERPPDVILLDINLGADSGLTFIRPIRKLAPSVKVVMFTTFRNVHYAAEAFRAGASGFLLKTYEIDDIVRLIRKAYADRGGSQLFRDKQIFSPALSEVVGETGAGVHRRFSLTGVIRQFLRTARSRIAH